MKGAGAGAKREGKRTRAEKERGYIFSIYMHMDI